MPEYKSNVQIDTRRIAINALFVAMALIMFLIESQFPPLLPFAPGAKMGLSNIFSVVALVIFGPIDAFVIVVVRCLMAVMFGTPVSALMYSLSGGLVSLTLMIILYTFVFPRITIIAISIAGAIMHNIAQVIVMCIQYTWATLSYLPMLCVAGVLAGIVVGFAAFFIIKYLPVNIYYKPPKEILTETEILESETKITEDNENE